MLSRGVIWGKVWSWKGKENLLFIGVELFVTELQSIILEVTLDAEL
jgi:hypothetical protein